jgi:hypothetical protein
MAALIGHSPSAIVGAPGDVDTSARNPVLTRAFDTAGNEYIYLKGVASTVDGAWVSFDEAGVTALLDTGAAATLKGPVALATGATIASTWGWYLIYGTYATAKAISGGSAADNALVYATSTAGVVDDVAADTTQILGAVFRSAEGATTAGDAVVQVNYPFGGLQNAVS